jgi:hypothetical protein
MTEDLKKRLKDIRKSLDDNSCSLSITDIVILKHDPNKQRIDFDKFISDLVSDIKKSSIDGRFLYDLSEEFDGLSLSTVRYAIEKSVDRYETVLDLMKKYDYNYTDDELCKTSSRLEILQKVLCFMISNNMGDYHEIE